MLWILSVLLYRAEASYTYVSFVEFRYWQHKYRWFLQAVISNRPRTQTSYSRGTYCHGYILEQGFIRHKLIHRPVKEKNQRKIVIYFLSISFNMFWVLKRTVSLRRFFWVPTTYVLVEK